MSKRKSSNEINELTNIVPAVEKTINILELLESAERGLNLTEISSTLKIPKSTTFRILTTLKHFGYVEQENDRGPFILGLKILKMATAVKDKLNLTKTALPFMEKLTRITGETSKLGVMRNDWLLVICKVQSNKEMSINTEIGRIFPLHAGAASKIMLAHLPEEEIERIIGKGLKKYTPNTITDPVQLREALRQIARQGFAEDNEEYTEGVKSIAFPIFDYSGRVVAALSIPFLAAKYNNEKRNNLMTNLFLTAREISEALGHSQI